MCRWYSKTRLDEMRLTRVLAYLGLAGRALRLTRWPEGHSAAQMSLTPRR